MVDFKAYNKIEEYCKENNHPAIYKKLLFYKYTEEMKSLIDSYKTKNSINPNSDILTGFDNSCLSDDRLHSDIKLIKEELYEFTSFEVKKFTQKQSIKAFGISVGASVLASFIFVILAIGIYKVGENQFNSWFSNDPSTHIEEKINIEGNTPLD
ncbi:hypothetical protein [Fusibacter ferrireducens]|uniref:Uncharacterized protein n=1 Tax=Fusibacter ferrireducens TaxID=2785058 RepID=A0ABR9ZNH3_9FIRM|nr:hypothetical protein [Fusibacter ferrireducens]MBF4692022.1 hypothetical protein [Fusibacter ferrireducens]